MELTRILDSLKDADGQPARGRIVVECPGFIAADNTAVAAGPVTYNIPALDPGKVDFWLAPTEGSDPPSAYKVRYFLSHGAAYEETWNVPRVGPVTIGQARGTA